VVRNNGSAYLMDHFGGVDSRGVPSLKKLESLLRCVDVFIGESGEFCATNEFNAQKPRFYKLACRVPH
jgi:hypothetical protein